MLWNNNTQINSTQINVNVVTNDGIDIDIFLGLLQDTEVITLQDKSESDNFQRWEINGTPINNTTYWSIPVTLLDSGGTGTTNFANGLELILALVQGVSGFSGQSGVSGFSGQSGVSGFSGTRSIS